LFVNHLIHTLITIPRIEKELIRITDYLSEKEEAEMLLFFIVSYLALRKPFCLAFKKLKVNLIGLMGLELCKF
jgi:hypothetical protein